MLQARQTSPPGVSRIDHERALHQTMTNEPVAAVLLLQHCHGRWPSYRRSGHTRLRCLPLHLPGWRCREPEHLSAESRKGSQVLHVVGYVRFLHGSCWYHGAEDRVDNPINERQARHCSRHLHEHRSPCHLYRPTAPRHARVPSNTSKPRLEQASSQDCTGLVLPSRRRSYPDRRLHHPLLLQPQSDPQNYRPLDTTSRNPIHADV